MCDKAYYWNFGVPNKVKKMMMPPPLKVSPIKVEKVPDKYVFNSKVPNKNACPNFIAPNNNPGRSRRNVHDPNH